MCSANGAMSAMYDQLGYGWTCGLTVTDEQWEEATEETHTCSWDLHRAQPGAAAGASLVLC